MMMMMAIIIFVSDGNIGGTTSFTDFANLTGGSDADGFTFTDTGSLNGALDGAGGTDTLTGDNDGNAFDVTGSNAGTLTGKTSGWSSSATCIARMVFPFYIV